MVYVIDASASQIKRQPTENEIDIVRRQGQLMHEIHDRYIELYAGKKVSGIDAGLRDKLWNRYLKELSKYNALFIEYIGYCY